MSSLPAVGDIDGDGRDEIIGLKDANYLSAYKYSPERNVLYEFWTIRHTDISAQTGITLFDFNSDGVEEIVYRDESLLRVINGSGKSYITGKDTIKKEIIKRMEKNRNCKYIFKLRRICRLLLCKR